MDFYWYCVLIIELVADHFNAVLLLHLLGRGLGGIARELPRFLLLVDHLMNKRFVLIFGFLGFYEMKIRLILARVVLTGIKALFQRSFVPKLWQRLLLLVGLVELGLSMHLEATANFSRRFFWLDI